MRHRLRFFYVISFFLSLRSRRQHNHDGPGRKYTSYQINCICQNTALVHTTVDLLKALRCLILEVGSSKASLPAHGVCLSRNPAANCNPSSMYTCATPLQTHDVSSMDCDHGFSRTYKICRYSSEDDGVKSLYNCRLHRPFDTTIAPPLTESQSRFVVTIAFRLPP